MKQRFEYFPFTKKIALFCFYAVLLYLLMKQADVYLNLGYVLEQVEALFLRYYPVYGRAVYLAAVTVPQAALYLSAVCVLVCLSDRYLSGIAGRLWVRSRITRLVRAFVKTDDRAVYEKVLGTRFVGFALLFGIFVGIYGIMSYRMADAEAFFRWQLVWARLFVACFSLYLCGFVLGNMKWVKAQARLFLFTGGNAYNLAVVRVILFFFLLMFYRNALYENAFWMDMPGEALVPLPYTAWWAGCIPVSHGLYAALACTGIALCILAILGLGTRWVMYLNILVGLYVLGMPMFFGKLFHIHIWIWFPAIMAFGRPADVWSVDALIRKRKGLPAPYPVTDPVYGLPVKFILLHFGIIYFFAGVIKLWDCGFDWALTDSVINRMQVEWIQHYDKIPAIRVDRFPALVKAGSLAVIVFEIMFPFLVLSRRWRWTAFAMGLAFHWSVAYFMYIGFFDLQVSYLLVVNWAAVWTFVRHRGHTRTVVAEPVSWRGNRDYVRLLVFGTLLWGVNFVCGVFRVHSWPFSSYPTYSSLVPGTQHYIYFEALDRQGTAVDVDGMGRAAGFRKESYTPIEDRIQENVAAHDSLAMKNNVARLWRIWAANVPGLGEVRTVKVWLRETPVQPGRQNRLLKNEYLLTFTPQDL